MPNSYSSWRTGVQIDNIYPVGSFYFSANSTNPKNLFGGTWEQVTGRFLFAADSSHAAGTTGGSLTMAHTHTLSHTHSQVAVTSGGPSNNTSGSTAITIAQMPSHAHRTTWVGNNTNNGIGWGFSYSSGTSYWSNSTAGSSSGMEATGSGQGHTHTLSSHTHSIAATTTGGASATTTSAASNTDNMPPYLSVYVFKRVA